MELTRVRRIAAVGAIGVALAATTLVTTTAGAAVKSNAAKTCAQKTDDKWPARVQGRPAGINPNTTAATYMWHDGNGWHIRVTHRTTNLKSFSGQLTTTGTFVNAKPVRLEKNDTFAVSADGHTVTFLFKNYGRIDGVNFFTRCAPSINFAFQSDGHATPKSRIVIGKNSVHPKHNPFTIAR